MLILEIFGTSKRPEQIISKLEKMFAKWRGHLHLAHTAHGHHDKNDFYRLSMQDFNKLKQQHKQGKDVSTQLQNLKKSITSHVNNI